MADLDLARRATRAAGWVWRRPERVVGLGDGRLVYRVVESGMLWVDIDGEWLPDLDDPATLGCMLALVRERWSDPEAWVFRHARWMPAGEVVRWQVYAGQRPVEMCRARRGGMLGEGCTEAEALVVALEADPHT